MKTLIEMPEGWSNKTDVPDNNVGDMDCISRKAVQTRLKEIINEMETIFADIREREVNDSVCGLCEYDCDHGLDGFANKCPGFEKDDCFKLNEKYRAEWLDISNLPSVTPQEPRWTSVSEKLPEPFTYVNATCRSLIDDREDWVIETLYLPIPKEANKYGYSDWGNIPMLNRGDAEVIAWVERIIPEPYKARSEG